MRIIIGIFAFLFAAGGIWINLISDLHKELKLGVAIGSTIAFVASLSIDLYLQRKTDQFTFDDERRYQETMLSLIKSDSVITIVTTQLEWVTERNDIGLELAKKSGSLTLIMLEKNIISTFFASKGARVFYYKDLGFEFSGGFTIIGDPDDVHRIAIGMKIPNRDKTKPDRRRLHIFRSFEDPAARLAQCQYHYLKNHGSLHV